MKVGSLCTGYGGIELGLTLAGVAVDLRWWAEMDTALDVIPHMGNEWATNLGDITVVDWAQVERVDMITAGFPCQPTSSAGRQLGDADPRWLWPAVHRAISILLPDQVLLENVRNLISYDKGRLWAGILADLTRLGYDVRWLTLGACHVGAAHHRHRVFALARRRPATADHSTVERIATATCGAKHVNVPTPTAMDAVGARNETARRSAGQDHQHAGTTLGDFARLLPSPMARDGDGRGEGDLTYWEARGAERDTVGALGAAVALLPSPTASDHSGAGHAATRDGGANLRTTITLLPTPRATDGVNGGPGQRGVSGDLAMSSAVQPEHWGRFGAAVARQAELFGPPPAPTEPNRSGAPRLSAAFAEWLMCIPAGHVTAYLPRAAALKAIGNGVCPPQLAAAYRLLADISSPTERGPAIMPSKAETEAQAVNAQRARDQALAQSALNASAVPCDDVGPTSLSTALMAIVEGWRAEVISLEGVTKRGTTGRKVELRAAAGLLAQVAKDVAALPSPEIDDEATARRAAVAAQQAERIATMGPLTANLPDDPNHWSALRIGAATVRHEVTSAEAAAAFAGIPGPDIPGSFGPGDRPLPQQPTTMPAMDGGPDVPALFIGDTITPPATTPEYAIGDQVTVGGINFAKISDNPFPVIAPTGAIVHAQAHSFTGPVELSHVLEAAHQQAMTDAAAYLAGATDVDPIENRAPVQPTVQPALEIFDPTPRQPAIPRLTYGAVSTFWSQIAPLDHKSFSQVETAEDCAMKALLNRAARSNLIPAGQPQWATVGGTAFHSAIEQIETGILVAGGAGPETPSVIQSLWLGALDRAIETEETRTSTKRADWRVANKGLEGYDWWRVEGERMVKMYLDHHTIERRQAASILHLKDAAGGPDRLAVELPFRLDVDGVADDGFIDQVWYDQASPTPFAVRDLKSGRSEPDTFQLAGYAWALSRQWSVPIEMFTGAFWLARKGIYSTPIVIAERHPWDEMVFRFHNAQRVEQAQVATPRVSGFCNGCEHKLLCPAGPR
jgi:DNA (cytosine-5)-methyltransferase 1